MKIAWSNWGQAEGKGSSRCLATCWSSEPAGYYRHYPSELNHHPSEPRLLSQPKPNIISLYKYLWSQRYTEVILLCWIIMKGALCHIYLHKWNLKRKSTEPFNRQWWIFKNANKPKEPYKMLHNNVNSTIGIHYHRYLVFLGYICGTFCVWLLLASISGSPPHDAVSAVYHISSCLCSRTQAPAQATVNQTNTQRAAGASQAPLKWRKRWGW